LQEIWNATFESMIDSLFAILVN